MGRVKIQRLEISTTLLERLKNITKQRHVAIHHKERVLIWLSFYECQNRKDAAQASGLSYAMTCRWVTRLYEFIDILEVHEQDEQMPQASKNRFLLETLSDAPRTGAPPVFTDSQIAQILALAKRPPKDYGLELSHWTRRELAKQAVKEGIVESIGKTSIHRFLKISQSQSSQL